MLPLSPSATKPLFAKFFPSEISAFVTDRQIDFSFPRTETSFNNIQKDYLSSQWGIRADQVVNIHQVHGDSIRTIEDKTDKAVREADAIVTCLENVAIAVRTADCLPIFIYDESRKVIGLVHAGWRGTEKEVVLKTINLMQSKFDSQATHLKIAFGPAIRSCCYEVGQEFKNIFPDDLTLRESKIYLDLISINKKQILKAGVLPKNIFDCTICTYCDKNYFSYRREKDSAGRMLSLMMLKG